MRTQMHQEAFPGEDISDRPPPEESVPGLLALIEGDRPSGRYRARDARRRRARERARLRAARARSRRTSRPRRAGSRATRCALLVAERATRPLGTRASATCRDLLDAGRPARRQHVGDAARGARRARADGTRARAARCPRRAGAPACWLVELRRRRRPLRAAARAPGERVALPGGGDASSSRPYLPARGSGSSRLDARRRRSRVPRRATAGRSATATSPREWPLDAYQTVFATEPGQRRDAERRPARSRPSW